MSKKKKSIKAPLTHDPGKGRPKEHLAYLNWQEMEALKRLNGNNMERGPKGLPSFADDSASSKGVSRAPSSPTSGSTSSRTGSTSMGSNSRSTSGTSISRSTSSTSRSTSTAGTGRGVTSMGSNSQRTSGTSISRNAAGTGRGVTSMGSNSQNTSRNNTATRGVGSFSGVGKNAADAASRQAAATRDAKSAASNRSLQNDAKKGGITSISVGPNNKSVSIPGSTINGNVRGALQRVADQARYPSRGTVSQPPKATTDLTAISMNRLRDMGTPKTNPNYAKDYADYSAWRDTAISRVKAASAPSIGTVRAGSSFQSASPSDAVSRALAARGFNPDGTRMIAQDPSLAGRAAAASKPSIAMDASFPGRIAAASVPMDPSIRGRVAAATTQVAMDPSIAGRIAEANKNYRTVTSGPYASRVYDDPDLRKPGPSITDTLSSYAKSALSGIGSLFPSSPLPGTKITAYPGLTYQEDPYKNLTDGLQRYTTGDIAMTNALNGLALTKEDKAAIRDAKITTGLDETGVRFNPDTGYLTMVSVPVKAQDRVPQATAPMPSKINGYDVYNPRDYENSLAISVPSAEQGLPSGYRAPAKTRSTTGSIQPMGYTPDMDGIVALSAAADPYVTSVDMMRAMQRNMRVGGGPRFMDSQWSTAPYTPGDYAAYREENGMNQPRSVNPAQEETAPYNDATLTPEAEAAQEADRKRAKRAQQGLSALGALDPTHTLGLFGQGLKFLNNQTQKLVDRYQDASIEQRAIMERQYPNLIAHARSMGIQTGLDDAEADKVYRSWADRTRGATTGRDNPDLNRTGPAASGGGGGGGGSSGGGNAATDTDSGGRPYIYYKWDVGVDIPSPGDSTYTLYQKYLAEKLAAAKAMGLV